MNAHLILIYNRDYLPLQLIALYPWVSILDILPRKLLFDWKLKIPIHKLGQSNLNKQISQLFPIFQKSTSQTTSSHRTLFHINSPRLRPIFNISPFVTANWIILPSCASTSRFSWLTFFPIKSIIISALCPSAASWISFTQPSLWQFNPTIAPKLLQNSMFSSEHAL